MNNIFSRTLSALAGVFERKSDPTFPMAHRHERGQPAWSGKDMKMYFDEGYKKNTVIFACIERKSRAAAHVPLLLVDKRTKLEVTEHPIIDLLKKPNPRQGGFAFIEAAFAYYNLTGNCYMTAVGQGSDEDPRNPFELWIMRPDFTRVIPTELGVGGYEFQCNGGKKYFFCDPLSNKSPVMHWKSFNPTSDIYGMSPMEAAAYAVDQHNEGAAWNKSLLENSAQPSGAMVTPNVLTESQFERLKKQIDQSMRGSKNAGASKLIFEGGLEWKQFSLSPREMDWINGRNVTAREIAVVYNVPPQLVNIPGDSTFNNYREARMAFYEDGVLQDMDMFLDELNRWLVPMFDGGENLELKYNEDALPALAPKREMTWKMVSEASFLTINERREALNYERLTIPEADEVFITSGLLPLKGSLGDPTDPAKEDLPEGGDPNADGADTEDAADQEDPGEPMDETAQVKKSLNRLVKRLTK